jgi:MerR family transcriptional regulator, light-induced transcriptional regulator
LSHEYPSDPGSPGRVRLLQDLREAYTAALLVGTETGAELVVREAIDAGLEGEVIYREVLAPSMRRIGDLWEEGSVSVADEHLATQITLRVLALEREAVRVARRRGAVVVMLAAVEGEHHVVGLQMTANLLAQGGYDTRFLGADVPIDSLAPVVERHQPDVFALSATMPEAGELLGLAIDEIRTAHDGIVLLVGGQGVPEHVRDKAGLSVLRHEITGVVECVDALVQRPEMN